MPDTLLGIVNIKRSMISSSLEGFLFCFVLFFILFIYLFMAALGLHCCARAFSSCGERGATLHCGARASHCGGFSLWSTGSRRTGFSSCGMRAQ